MLKNKNFWLVIVIIMSFVVFFLGKCSCGKDISMVMNHPHNVKGVISYKRSFSDLNDTHLTEAHALGITPLQSEEQAKELGDKLVKIENCDKYQVDELTHSIPYLVPVAANLLVSIGSNFLDSLHCKGLNPYNIIVTSILRTPDKLKQLVKYNGNAKEASAHSYGTTFDVSYNRFVQVLDPDGRPYQKVNSDTLKLVLSEVLRDLRENKRCYVKYELKQGCFHITARSFQ